MQFYGILDSFGRRRRQKKFFLGGLFSALRLRVGLSLRFSLGLASGEGGGAGLSPIIIISLIVRYASSSWALAVVLPDPPLNA